MNPPQTPPPGAAPGDDNDARLEIRWQTPAPKTQPFELTDELVLCCLDQMNWRPVVRERIIGLGLAAAVIGQLVSLRHVQVVDQQLVMSYTSQAPTTVLALEAWEAIKAEHSAQPVKIWLRYLAEQGMGAGGVFVRVTERMASRGLITLERQGFLSRRVAYVPTNPSTAAWPLVRLRQRVNRADLEAPGGRDAYLAGVLSRMGLAPLLADDELGRSRLEASAGGLEPQVQKLLGQLDVAVGEAAMTQRP